VDDTATNAYPIVADPAITVTTYDYAYVNVQKTTNYTNRSVQLGICKVAAGGSGTTCKIANSYSVDRNVESAFGINTDTVTAAVQGIWIENRHGKRVMHLSEAPRRLVLQSLGCGNTGHFSD
jgi:hypothetical protein